VSFLDGLLPATWRGIPFHVALIENKLGRRQAVHEYPYRDTVWIEDLGRAPRVFRFSGFMLGPLATLQVAAMSIACEKNGAGTLTHPAMGVFTVALMSFVSIQTKDEQGCFAVEFEFCETGEVQYPAATASTGDAVKLGSLNLLNAAGTTFGTVLQVVGTGAAVLSVAGSVLRSWLAIPTRLASDAGAIVGAVTGLGSQFGRYAGGRLTTRAPSGSTAVILLASGNRVLPVVIAASNSAQSSISTGQAVTIAAAVSSTSEVMRGAVNDPADQVRLLSAMTVFSPSATFGVDVTGLAMGIMQAGIAALCRQSALASLALAASSYRPSSYDDAITLRDQVATLLDNEIKTAGNAGDDPGFSAMRALRAAVVADLTKRGATLAPLADLSVARSLPALVLAHRLYQDGTRADELVARVNPAHPSFMPQKFRALAG
jgi:prophage DNA circulation protein